MKARKHLLTHVFVSLAALPLAVPPAFALSVPSLSVPSAHRQVVLAQASPDAARQRVEEARRALEEAKAKGGDVAGAEAALKAAESELQALEAAPPKAEPPKEAPPAEAKPEPPKSEPPKSEPAPPAPPKPAAQPQDTAPPPPKPAEPKPAEPKAAEPKPAAPKPEEQSKPQEKAPVQSEAPAPAAKPVEKPAPEAAKPPPPKPESAPSPEKPADGAAPAPQSPPDKKPEQKAAPTPDAAPKPGPSTTTPETKGEAAPAPQRSLKAAPSDATAPAAAPAQAPESSTAAPVLDSAKQAPALDSAKEAPAPTGVAPQSAPKAAPSLAAPQPSAQTTAAPPPPPPKSDADAQAPLGKVAPPPRLAPTKADQGRRLEGRPRFDAPRDAKVEDHIDGRDILNILGQMVVRGGDADRFTRNGARNYYEELPGGRTRETVQRPNGVEVVTIRNRYGDVIQRSRIGRDGRETVLFYAPDLERRPDRESVFRDPSLDLPPMRLDIPVDEYIIDTSRARNPDYYDFLREPPVEKVQRVYSLDEVRYSARVRDMMRRVDLDTIHFATGSADVSTNEARSLKRVAEAMKKIIDRNPGETFLIEGHTDAVGSDQANLVLSDRRAESVAVTLTDLFGIPPENLVTQGYGERFLKVRTSGPSQENRRVTIRRITPLVRPVDAKR